jgi:predicted house-cleaning noncanonical NTP pyrophosphatase (MazG superfamily)
LLGEELGRLPWDERAGLHVQAEASELFEATDVGDGLAGRAADDQVFEALLNARVDHVVIVELGADRELEELAGLEALVASTAEIVGVAAQRLAAGFDETPGGLQSVVFHIGSSTASRQRIKG